jgi:SAM-dependent methyltransferase
MKTRESGMPDEVQWASFFQPASILDRLLLRAISGDVVEFGCGYGTFTIPAARRCTGHVYALDIEAGMVAHVAAKTDDLRLRNVRPILRDFVKDGTGLPDCSVAYAMMLNILHAEESPVMLAEALRVLAPGSLLGIMHWNYDATTPRGPSMEIRPRPEECQAAAVAAGFRGLPSGIIDLPPYHYGMVLTKPAIQP